MKGKNQALETYCKIYKNIQESYLTAIQGYGLSLAKKTTHKDSIFSHSYGWKSPACVACHQGNQSASFYLSLKCHRQCYYCFNPNQEHYAIFRQQMNNATALLRNDYNTGRTLNHIALTGGEPLLHRQETLEFFRMARTLYPKAYLRLYTSGDLLEDAYLLSLKEAGLDEIRFSIKLEDDEQCQAIVYKKITLAKQYIEKVMVEMPVIPGTRQEMQHVLLKLANYKITGINLLEFCFPFHNAAEFQRRGFQIKNPPFHIFYNYDYAGGLPVDGSEMLCLELLKFAERKKLPLGVHYCSLANKLTAEIFVQNQPYVTKLPYYFSTQDFFFKSIKVFGADITLVQDYFQAYKIDNYQLNLQHEYIEFQPQYIRILQAAGINCPIVIAYYVVEKRENEPYLREVHLEAKHLADISLKRL